ncbi:hypothetical protein Bca4012_056549 [Brassica carinata]
MGLNQWINPNQSNPWISKKSLRHNLISDFLHDLIWVYGLFHDLISGFLHDPIWVYGLPHDLISIRCTNFQCIKVMDNDEGCLPNGVGGGPNGGQSSSESHICL